jgi:hypothetical protein
MPDRMRELLAEFAAAQSRPISDPALVERMKSEATQWINAVHMQHRRISHPLVDVDEPGAEVWRQEIDLHFLLVSLTRLRRAVGLVTRVAALRASVLERVSEFDDRLPYLPLLRNVGEHFDDYTVGQGRKTEVRRAELQTWAFDRDTSGQLVWRWLGEQLNLAEAHSSAVNLYRGFIADVEQYIVTLSDNAASP